MTEKAIFDPVVIALFEARTGERYDKEIAKRYAKSWGRLQNFAKWMFDNLDEVTPDNIRGFYASWYQNNPELNVPEKPEAYERAWANWLFSFRDRSPEKRIQTGPVFDPVADDEARRNAITFEEFLRRQYADDPTGFEAELARHENAAERYARKLRKPTEKMQLTREDTRNAE